MFIAFFLLMDVLMIIFFKFQHVISHIPAVRAAITDLRDITLGKGLSQWADISVLFKFSFKISIYEARLKYNHSGGNSVLT